MTRPSRSPQSKSRQSKSRQPARAAVATATGVLALALLSACYPLLSPTELGSTTLDEVQETLDQYFDAVSTLASEGDREAIQRIATPEWIRQLDRADQPDPGIEQRFSGKLVDIAAGRDSIKAITCVRVRETTVIDGLEITASGSAKLQTVSIVLNEDHQLAVAHVTRPAVDC